MVSRGIVQTFSGKQKKQKNGKNEKKEGMIGVFLGC